MTASPTARWRSEAPRRACRVGRPDLLAPPSAVTAWVGVGANLGDAARAVRDACFALDRQYGVRLVAASRRFRNPPLGPVQPDYVNAVARVETRLSPRELLETLWSIEQAAGRDVRGPRWGARALDLDLLLFGDEVFSVPGLTVPHVGLCERAFVLVPMADLVPDWPLPRQRVASPRLAGGEYGTVATVDGGASERRQAPGGAATLRGALQALPDAARAAMRPLDAEPLFGATSRTALGLWSSDRVASLAPAASTSGGAVTSERETVGREWGLATAGDVGRDDRGRDTGRGSRPWISPAA